MLPTNLPTIWLMAWPRSKKRNSITLSTTASSSTRATGSAVKVSSAPAASLTPARSAPRTSTANGASSSRKSLTTLRPSASSPACSPKPLAALWPRATTASASRSTSTTACSHSTRAIPTRVSSSTPTSCHQLALATSQSRLKHLVAYWQSQTRPCLTQLPHKVFYSPPPPSLESTLCGLQVIPQTWMNIKRGTCFQKIRCRQPSNPPLDKHRDRFGIFSGLCPPSTQSPIQFSNLSLSFTFHSMSWMRATESSCRIKYKIVFNNQFGPIV